MNARSIFRFRLATLLLVVFSIATGALIWMRWEPWMMEMRSEDYCVFEDGRYLISGKDNIRELWDFENDRRTPLPFQNLKAIREISLRSCTKRLVTLEENDVVRLWDVESLNEIGMIQLDSNEWREVYSVGASRVIATSPLRWEVWTVNPAQKIFVKECKKFKSPSVSEGGRFAIEDGILWDLELVQQAELPGMPEGFIGSTNLVLIQSTNQALVYDACNNIVRCCFDTCNAVELEWSKNLIWEFHTGEVRELSTGRLITDTDNLRETVPDTRLIGNSIVSRGDDEKELYTFPFSSTIQDRNMILYGGRQRVLVFDNGVEVWSRRHPEWWWGHFYRPEVWLGLLLSAVWLRKLFHSLRRRNS